MKTKKKSQTKPQTRCYPMPRKIRISYKWLISKNLVRIKMSQKWLNNQNNLNLSKKSNLIKARKQNLQIQEIINHLTKLLDHYCENNGFNLDLPIRVDVFLTSPDSNNTNSKYNTKKPLKILTFYLLKINTRNPSKFAFKIQINVKEPKTYRRLISGMHI